MNIKPSCLIICVILSSLGMSNVLGYWGVGYGYGWPGGYGWGWGYPLTSIYPYYPRRSKVIIVQQPQQQAQAQQPVKDKKARKKVKELRQEIEELENQVRDLRVQMAEVAD